MNMSGAQSDAIDAYSEDVIQAFKNWRAKDLAISQGSAVRENMRHSIILRVFRTIAFGLIAVSIALAVVAWQSGTDEMGKAASSLHAWLTQSRPVADRPSATLIGSIKEPTQNTAAAQGTLPLAAEQPNEEELSAIKRQIESLTNQLSEIRHIAEQLAASQQNIALDIAVLKTNQESISKRLLGALPHPPNAFAAPKKKPQEPARSGSIGRSSTERSSGGTPLPLH